VKELLFKSEAPAINPISNSYITAQMNLIFRARMLWRDLATWLRAYMVSLYGGVGNTEDISKRLFRIPVEHGNIFKVFFGDQATAQYINLLTEYIAILESLFNAQINNDVNTINDLTRQLYQNVINTAALLASVNPFWQQSEWVTLLNAFTSMQLEEATTFLTKEYSKNIDIFDSNLSLTNIIGDYFSEGLTNYFLLKQEQQAK
jgi:hypothetical protein